MADLQSGATMSELGRTSAFTNIVFEVGADFDVTFEIKANGVAVDLTGSTFSFPFYRTGAKTDQEIDQINVSITNAAAGLIRLLFTATEIAALTFDASEISAANYYVGRLLWTDSAGKKRRPLVAQIRISTGGK